MDTIWSPCSDTSFWSGDAVTCALAVVLGGVHCTSSCDVSRGLSRRQQLVKGRESATTAPRSPSEKPSRAAQGATPLPKGCLVYLKGDWSNSNFVHCPCCSASADELGEAGATNVVCGPFPPTQLSTTTIVHVPIVSSRWSSTTGWTCTGSLGPYPTTREVKATTAEPSQLRCFRWACSKVTAWSRAPASWMWANWNQ